MQMWWNTKNIVKTIFTVQVTYMFSILQIEVNSFTEKIRGFHTTYLLRPDNSLLKISVNYCVHQRVFKAKLMDKSIISYKHNKIEINL